MKKKESNDTGMGLVLGLSLGHGIKHFGQGAISVIGPLLKVSLNLSDVAYGAIFSASNVASGLANIPAWILSDKYRKKIAIGLSNYDNNDVLKIMGKKSNQIKKILGYEGREEFVHKDDLVIK